MAFKAQVNHRLSDFSSLDSRRKAEQHKFLELSTKIDYTEPYFLPRLFGDNVEGKASLSYKRKKFFSFDADIIRWSPIISKNFTEHFSGSLKYQLEKIRQYDATDVEKNDGKFTVGGFTASFSLDHRDSRVLPRRGYYLGFSSEFANPTFGSTESGDGDNEVDFMKFTSRNKYYAPLVFDNWTLATALSFGYQKKSWSRLYSKYKGLSFRWS